MREVPQPPRPVPSLVGPPHVVCQKGGTTKRTPPTKMTHNTLRSGRQEDRLACHRQWTGARRRRPACLYSSIAGLGVYIYILSHRILCTMASPHARPGGKSVPNHQHPFSCKKKEIVVVVPVPILKSPHQTGMHLSVTLFVVYTQLTVVFR